MNPQLQLMLQHAIQAFQTNNLDRAESILKKILQQNSKNLPALHILGLIKASQEKYQEAIELFGKAVGINPNDASIHYNLAKALMDSGNNELSIRHHQKSVELAPENPEAWLNYGRAESSLHHYDAALHYYRQALRLKPSYAEVFMNMGATNKELKRYEEAIACADQALALDSTLPGAWSNKGNVLSELRRYKEAVAHYEKALSLKPDLEWILGDLMYLRMRICLWFGYQDNLDFLINKIQAGERAATPLTLLPLIDDPCLHQQCAQIFTQEKYPVNLALGPIAKRAKSSKIRLGYFSADFGNHPVSLLTAELFELHDRNQFEVIAFSFGLDDQSAMRSRLQNTFDQFIDVTELSDQAVASLARDHKIDIAVDLGGHTKGARTGIFAYRAAPIQVNYLGYPGTLGADFMDYVIADSTIIPLEHQAFYSEAIVHLPHSYMVDDSQRLPSTRAFSRRDFDLPENAFVFCCFNNDYKFNIQVLNSWAKILLSIPGSVLWISENNEQFKENIFQEFSKRGINTDQIIFAKKVDLMSDHLARYTLADLFLDTHPYNAHTTAVDSLKASLPVLTLPGQSFASRVAASLLNAIELPELIASSRDHYEALAIELASNPSKLAAIKEKLVNNRQTTPLFNTPLFTQNLEKAYTQIYERYQADLPPDHVVVL